ncbi:hypothetical protein BOX15_Mlig024088g3 [Macrostomum lignano]|uniref:BTB domain-containing protein n=1 Tax=Macrostomum lignano TaxID=282301 RepID=A0A267FSX6_9PLAT|nr:hypothetical protein BOX15_Mlig024088g3 [Macrostomum lignano]
MSKDIIRDICVNDPDKPLSITPKGQTGELVVLHKAKPDAAASTLQCQYVKLNVGGYKYYTSVATLLKQESMLSAMFSGRMNIFTDSEGWVMIDRDGKHFGIILNYLRDGSTELPDSQKELRELLREAKYYCLSNLITKVEYALRMREVSWQSAPKASTNIILVNQSTQAEADAIVRSGVPVVKLTMNRHNNKYSYTTSSFDLLLKNNELFESLAVRFPDKVKFIKDVWGQSSNPENGICTWTFYFKGQPIGELDDHRSAFEDSGAVGGGEGRDGGAGGGGSGGGGGGGGDQATSIVCHSIFYGNEKKQTKVDFHENKVYSRFIKMFSLFINEDERLKKEAAAIEAQEAHAAMSLSQ